MAFVITTPAPAAADVKTTEPQLTPRTLLRKDLPVPLADHHRTDIINVKFLDDLPIRAEGGVLHDSKTGLLNDEFAAEPLFTAGEWIPLVDMHPDHLERMRSTAERNLGVKLADPRSDFVYFLPEGVTPQQAIDAFNAFGVVELAGPAIHAPPLPSAMLATSMRGTGVTPNYQGSQGYLFGAPTGVGATLTWQQHGVRGQDVRVADLEYGFNANHTDLPPVTVLTVGTPTVFPGYEDHGTAVIGQIAARSNNFGVTGIAFDADMYFSHTYINGIVNVSTAIFRCVAAFDPGDIILIEQQTWGPNSVGFPPTASAVSP